MTGAPPLRIAVISDIHGNLPALDAVLTDMKTRQVDLVVNLGDILSGGVDPQGTMQRLRTLECVTVAGNHERYVLEIPHPQMGKSDALAFEAMSSSDLAWFRSLPRTATPAPGILAFHGTPHDDSEYLLETVTTSGIRPATVAEVMARLGHHSERWELLLCGHTHIPRVIQLPNGATVLNPGSVGLPAYQDGSPLEHRVETGSSHARYALATKTSHDWNVDLIAIAYDYESAASKADSNGRPDVAVALRTGRATIHLISAPTVP